jgi:hypothetical protein
MEQKKNPTITIKLKPYLQEYLVCKLNSDDLTAKRTLIGVFMKPFLEYRPSGEQPEFSTGKEYVTIKLPTYRDIDVRNGTIYISENNQVEFERILNAHFWDVFFSFIDDKVRYFHSNTTKKGAIKKCILQFCSDYNISYNHLNYEMMKKAYYRERCSGGKNRNIFTNNLSLTCPLYFLI